MIKFENVVNPVTKATEKQASFTGELVSIAEKAMELNNEKKTKYFPASVNIPEIGVRSCIIYKANFDHGMVVGGSYRGRVTIAPDANGKVNPIITLSHLTSADRATLADFGLAEEVTADANLDDVK